MKSDSQTAPSSAEAEQVGASTPRNGPDRRVVLVAAGFAAGVCIVLTAAGLHILQRGQQIAASLAAPPTATATARPPAPMRTRTPTVTPMPTTLASPLELAEKYLYEGDPQRAIDLISPLVDQGGDSADLARANDLLGQAESMLGHYQRAAAHLQAAFDLDPTAMRLYELAFSYDAGGDLERALDAYVRLLDWPDETAEEYRIFCELRIEDLIEVLGTRTPSATPR